MPSSFPIFCLFRGSDLHKLHGLSGRAVFVCSISLQLAVDCSAGTPEKCKYLRSIEVREVHEILDSGNFFGSIVLGCQLE